jgi:hypothetical protein
LATGVTFQYFDHSPYADSPYIFGFEFEPALFDAVLGFGALLFD